MRTHFAAVLSPPPPPPPPPDEHALYKDNFATGNGELSKVIADITQRDGNVLFVFFLISMVKVWVFGVNRHYLLDCS